jgi:replicative DNA helicase
MNEVTELLEKSKISIKDFFDVDSLTSEYMNYSQNIDSKKIDLGFTVLTDLIRGLRTQELLTIISKTGVGKSALILNFLLNFVKKTNELCVLFSCEMSSVSIAERVFQIELDKFGFQIEDNFTNNNEDFIKQCYTLKQSLKNFVIITKRIDVHEIPDYIRVIEKMKNKKCRLIGVDYLGLLDNRVYTKDEYLRNTDNMRKLYSYAKVLDSAIINLSQTSRADIKSGEGLTLYSGKSSGEVENSSDFVLTLEHVNNPTDKKIIEKLDVINDYNGKYKALYGEVDLMKLAVQKNRRGKTGNIFVVFNHKNLKIKEYNENDFNDKLF